MPLFTPPVAHSVGGNTAGALALISEGTYLLAGGNNITLSQNGNSVTISGAAGGGAAGSHTLGMSNLGNTSGTSGVISGSALQFILAGGNNITLSQSINGSSATITISGANIPAQTQESNTFGISNLGNTSGTSGVISGPQLRMMLAGGNNVTLSQSIDGSSATITISAFTQSLQTQMTGLTAGMSTLGNTSGTTGLVSNRLVLVGGDNITLSQSVDGQSATLTISAAAGGGGGVVQSMWAPHLAFDITSRLYTGAIHNAVIHFFPVTLYNSVNAHRLNLFQGSWAPGVASQNSTWSGGDTWSIGLYARDTAQTNRLTLMLSRSAFWQASGSSTTRIGLTYPVGTSDSTGMSTTTASTAAVGAESFVRMRLGGARIVPFPISSTLTPGHYWFAYYRSTTTANTILTAWPNRSMVAFNPVNGMGFQQLDSTSSIGSANNSVFFWMQGLGVYSTTTNAMPSSVSLTEIRGNATNTGNNALIAALIFFNMSGYTATSGDNL